VEPGFLFYFNIPKYSPHCPAHRRLADIGKEVSERGTDAETEEEIGRLVKERC